MTRPEITIHDTKTNEIIVREMNDEEYTIYVKKVADYELEKAALESAETKAATDKAALLAKLGITADEAKLLLS